MTSTLVTIAITAYNAEDSIEKALESAVGQDWPETEILVVDDASNDRTVLVIKKFLKGRANIRLITHSENLGVACARNTLLENALGEFVVFFDDDDFSLPTRVSKQIKAIRDYEKKFGAFGLVVCHSARIQKMVDGNESIEGTMGCKASVLAPNGRAVAERIITGKPLADGYGALATCSQAARLITYRLIGGFDPAFRRGEDTDLAVRLALSGAHFKGLSEPLVIQTMTHAAEKDTSNELSALYALLKKHQSMFQNQRQYNFALRWARLKFSLNSDNKLRAFRDTLSLFASAPMHTLKRIAYALPSRKSRAARKMVQRSRNQEEVKS